MKDVAGPDLGTAPLHRANWGIFALSVLTPALTSMVILAVAPGLLEMAHVFGRYPAELVETLPTLFMIIGAAGTGFLSERVGRRTTLIIALLGYAFCGISGYAAQNIGIMLAGRIGLGLSAGIMQTTTYAMISEYYANDRREKILGYMSMVASLASVGMLAAGGGLVQAFGWRAPFLVYGLALLLVPVAARCMASGTTLRQGERLSWTPVIGVWRIFVLLAVYTIGMFMLVIQGPFILAAHGITAPATIGTLLSVSSVFGAFGGFCYGFMRRWLGFHAMFIWISLMMGSGLLFAIWAPDASWFVFAAFVTGLGIGVIEPTIASEIMVRVPEPLHDRALGINVAALFCGPFLNPWVVAPLAGLHGILFAVAVLAGAYLLGGLGFIAALRGVRRPAVA